MLLPDRASPSPNSPRRVRRGKGPVRAQPQVELLESRCLPSTFRTIDGTDNNPFFSDWGSAGVNLLRAAHSEYADGLNAMTVGNPPRPSARLISNVIVAQTTPERVISDRFMSAMIYGWGQFLDHDIDLTPNGPSDGRLNDIIVPNDPDDPFSTAHDPPGPGFISFTRSVFDPDTGHRTPRQQINVVTAFVDASMVYGSDEFVASALRTHVGGRLKTSPGADNLIGTQDDLLPYNDHVYFPGISQDPSDPEAAFKIANDAHRVSDHEIFMAGDVRANENIELTSLHTLFLREHNRLAGRILAANPSLGDEEVYQRARALVGAEIQSITYNQWLPTLLGPGALDPYLFYNPFVNPGIANEFSTASFRVGHSMLGDDVEFLDNDGEEVRGPVTLNDAFFNPPLLSQNDIGPILKYLASDPSSEVDNTITDPVRNFLFGTPAAGGFDLASLNIQRGRDHGLADYNDVRAAYGLPRVVSFAQISSDATIQAKLQQLYGNVNNIDLWVGGLAEDHVPGSSTGPLIRAVLANQFERLRDGDSFWFERIFSDGTLKALENRTLDDIIADNTPINNLQNNVFFFRLSISGVVFYDLDRDGRRDFFEPGLPGRTVQLFSLPDTQIPLATTMTGPNGSYKFDVADGLALGTFRVREVVPNGWIQTSPDPADITFTRGQQSAVNVNFGNARGFFSPASLPPADSGSPVGAAPGGALDPLAPPGAPSAPSAPVPLGGSGAIAPVAGYGIDLPGALPPQDGAGTLGSNLPSSASGSSVAGDVLSSGWLNDLFGIDPFSGVKP